jgi:hypothetical protein
MSECAVDFTEIQKSFVRGFYPDWNAGRCEELQFTFGVHRDTRGIRPSSNENAFSPG